MTLKSVKLLNKISTHLSNLQWEIDRMSEDGRKEYAELVQAWKKLNKWAEGR